MRGGFRRAGLRSCRGTPISITATGYACSALRVSRCSRDLSADEPIGVAGTRVLAALEAVRKAFATHDEELTVVERVETCVLFRARTSDKEALILTLPIRFSHGPQKHCRADSQEA